LFNTFVNTTPYTVVFIDGPRQQYIILCLLNAGDTIEKNEMGGVCGAYGGGERCVQGFGGET
jgi:hypothetical protein